MPFGNPAFSRRFLTFTAFGAVLAASSAARADVYYSVAPGDTLQSVAARYNVRADALRQANSLTSYADTMTLPAMLLRVPGRDDNSQGVVSVAAPTMRAPRSVATGSGTIRSTAAYRVQPNDTLQKIAQRYTDAGYNVSAEDIRLRNTLDGEPQAGTTLYVPLGASTYVATPRPNPAIRPVVSGYTPAQQSVGGAWMSEELPLPMAQVYRPDGDPVYQAPNEKRRSYSSYSDRRPSKRDRSAASSTRPSSLAGRGLFPNPSLNVRGGSLDGARIVSPSEDAPNLSPSNNGVTRAPQPQPSRSGATKPKAPALGRVAQVMSHGAQIRRLPINTASTLYRCATGTEVAVTQTQGRWVAILMSDYSTGWIPAKYLRYTGKIVDVSSMMAKAPNYDDSETWQRGGSFALRGNWTSNNPLVAQALTWMGTPYVYGGTGRRGIDCSALVQNSFASLGYRLPRTAAQQARVGQLVSDPAKLQPGDRLYFSKSGTRIDHTGLYMGGGRFVHASGTGRAVIVSSLAHPRNWNIYVLARR